MIHKVPIETANCLNPNSSLIQVQFAIQRARTKLIYTQSNTFDSCFVVFRQNEQHDFRNFESAGPYDHILEESCCCFNLLGF
jgi:hypothetical protein